MKLYENYKSETGLNLQNYQSILNVIQALICKLPIQFKSETGLTSKICNHFTSETGHKLQN